MTNIFLKETSDYIDNYLTAVFFKGVLNKHLGNFKEAKDCLNIVLNEWVVIYYVLYIVLYGSRFQRNLGTLGTGTSRENREYKFRFRENVQLKSNVVGNIQYTLSTVKVRNIKELAKEYIKLTLIALILKTNYLNYI